MSGKVAWYGDKVTAMVDDAADLIIERIAFYVEGAAKTRAPVDTGFMRNAIYTIAPGGSGRSQATAQAKSVANREVAPSPSVGEHEAAVHAAAGYTIYQENRVGFLWGGLEEAAGQFPNIAGVVRLG